MKDMKSLGRGLAVFFSIVVFVGAPIVMGPSRIPWAFAWAVAGLLGVVVLVGQTVGGRYLGALINERNVMSLTRLQAMLWSVLIVAAFAAMTLAKLSGGQPLSSIFNVEIDPKLLALMGISFGSAVGSNIMSTSKSTDGVLFKNASPSAARFFDIFEGDEIADQAVVDVSKVQMFFFTMIGAAAFIYAAVTHDLTNGTIPVLNANLLALMGISHAAYLGGKMPTKTTDAQVTEQEAKDAQAKQQQAQTSIISDKPVTGPQVTQ